MTTSSLGSPTRPQAVILLIFAMLAVQFGAAIAKPLFATLGAAGTSAMRTGLAALILLAIWRPWRGMPTAHALRAIVAYGAVLGTMNLTFYMALERIPLGLAVALEFTGPLAVAISSTRRLYDGLWAILAAVGIISILPPSSIATLGALGAPAIPTPSDAANVDPVGILFALLAAACWALYIVLGKRVSSKAGTGTVTSLGMLTAAIVTLPWGVAQAGVALVAPATLPLVFAIAVLSSALPYSLEMLALRSLPAKSFGILMSLEPAVAALLGLALLNEALTLQQWGAIACVIAASVGTTITARR